MTRDSPPELAAGVSRSVRVDDEDAAAGAAEMQAVQAPKTPAPITATS